MRALIVAACMFAAPALAQDPLSTGVFVPLQMPDGSQLWRWVGKELKGEGLEIRYTDMLAQTMAARLWCPRGWDETKRSTPTKGYLMIEGRCK